MPKLDFNLVDGQVRAQRIAHGHGWFDQAGKLIARGDLDKDDFLEIARTIRKGKAFITIPEASAHPDNCIEEFDYVLMHASFVVTSDQLCCIDTDQAKKTIVIYGLEFAVISREEAEKLIRS